MIIGVDAHKATHTAAAVNRQTAELLDQVTSTPASRPPTLLEWATDLDGDRVWAIEDARNLSGTLERHLLARRTGVARSAEVDGPDAQALTDVFEHPIGALAVARAAIREPDLPPATMPGIEDEIGLLADHRNDLVTDCTGHQRRLHSVDEEPRCPSLNRGHERQSRARAAIAGTSGKDKAPSDALGPNSRPQSGGSEHARHLNHGAGMAHLQDL